jgi:hypothetical protein
VSRIKLTQEQIELLVSLFPLDGDNLFTAARRVARSLGADDHAHGGLLSLDTIKANDIMRRHIEALDVVLKDWASALEQSRQISVRADRWLNEEVRPRMEGGMTFDEAYVAAGGAISDLNMVPEVPRSR